MDYTDSDVLIIDNASKNNPFKEIQGDRVHVICNKKNLGYSGGNNIGLKYALENNYQYSWVLNPDIEIESNTLELLLETMKQNSKIAAVGPRICDKVKRNEIYSDGGILNSKSFSAWHLNSGLNIHDVDQIDNRSEPDYVNGSCILIRNKALSDIGLFYEKFFMYYEETEWCWRAKTKGYTISINKNAVVYHERSKKEHFFHYYLTRNRSVLSRIITGDRNWAKIRVKDLLKETKNNFFLKEKTPYLFDQLKGAIAGYVININGYKDSIQIEDSKVKMID